MAITCDAFPDNFLMSFHGVHLGRVRAHLGFCGPVLLSLVSLTAFVGASWGRLGLSGIEGPSQAIFDPFGGPCRLSWGSLGAVLCRRGTVKGLSRPS
eukprot:576365-Pyramimonas_sp.AAC.1